ncbi:PucR family transcriptional regulator [Streptomyces sp. NPDC050658]|uniref:PucR family transcriptional regulator n=1 Tax=unclassified Streptomyces TaxID=2593676 RepID=UPI00341CA558
MKGKQSDPFYVLPQELSERFFPLLPAISNDIVAAICEGVPEYVRPSDAKYRRILRKGVEEALRTFIDRMGSPSNGTDSVSSTYELIGAGEASEGRTLEVFHVALRLGSRVAWQKVVQYTDDSVLPRRQLATLAEAMLVHIDDISAAAITGFTRTGVRRKQENALRRERLVSLLTASPPASAEAIEDLAHACQWRVPQRLAVAVTEALPPGIDVRPSVPPGVLVGKADGALCLVIPDPESPGRRAALRRLFGGRGVVVGPELPVTEGASSLRMATDARCLARNHIIPRDDVVFCSDHLATLLLFRDRKLMEVLSAHHLRPLAELAPQRRDRLAETLLVWLRSGNSVTAVAGRLLIHPQTVRYRLRQLENLYGAKLREPDVQFELELVLRAWALQKSASERDGSRSRELKAALGRPGPAGRRVRSRRPAVKPHLTSPAESPRTLRTRGEGR